MKTIFNVIILLLIFSVPLYSQGKISKNASQFQLDVFGPGSLFSINFDSRFAKKENGIGIGLELAVHR